MNILFITFGLPFPPSSGARIRDFNLISRLARRHRVSVLSLLESADEAVRLPEFRAYCAAVDGVVADRGAWEAVRNAVSGLLAGRPLATVPFYYPELARKIQALSASESFDLVQIEHSFLAPYRSSLAAAFTGATVLSFHNIGVQQYRSMFDMSAGLARLPAALKWLAMRGWEAREARRFDHSIVVSKEDEARLRALGVEDRITVIENGVDVDRLRVLPEPATAGGLLFIGTFGYLPNRDAVGYFCKRIMPIVRSRYPSCHLTVVGSGALDHLAHLANDKAVTLVGRVEDPVPYYQDAQIAVAPLRSGGGSRLKILEAMALGRPVVSSTLGCEGLEVEVGKDLLVADDPETFAGQVLTLLNDRAAWRDVVRAARDTVERRYDWDRVADRLQQLHVDLHHQRGTLRQPAQWVDVPADGEPPLLSVVIPVYNAEASLGQCLDALQRSRMSRFELFIVDDCSTDGSVAIARARCENVTVLDRNHGQATARNRGASQARGKLLFFLDADVLTEPDTLDRVVEILEGDDAIAALFCSYQQDTPGQNFFSQFKNLQHHHTHQTSGREASSFCGGFGLVRRDVFMAIGGFDDSCRAMEDVEFGYRLHLAGHRIELHPEIQLTHTKRYTLRSLVNSDFFQRAIPWTRVMLERRIFRSDLNLRPNNLLGLVVVCLMLLAPFLPPPFWLTEATLLVVFVLLNQQFLVFLLRMRGTWFALRSVPMLWFQYFYSGLGGVLGTIAHFWGRLRSGRSSPQGRPR